MGVCERVTDCVKELRDMGESAKMTTAYGLTEAFKCMSGTGQGCNAAPVRSAIQLVVTLTMETVHELGMGYCTTVPAGGERACIRQSLYADDLNGPTRNAQGVQLLIDLAGVSAKVSGNIMGIEDKATKTAYHLFQCQEGVRVVDDRYDVRSMEGTGIPIIRESYRLVANPTLVQESTVHQEKRHFLCSLAQEHRSHIWSILVLAPIYDSYLNRLSGSP